MKAPETHVAAQEQVRILGISGSLRKASFSTAILWALARRTSASMSFDVMTLAEIPLYNEDLACPPGPPAVENMKKLIAESDGVLIATPEYDHGIPGVLKNALDWASRPRVTSPLKDKPVAVLGASPGRGSTARAQTQLRDAFVFTGACVMPLPELLVGAAASRFDEAGN